MPCAGMVFAPSESNHLREYSKVRNILVRTAELLMLGMLFATGATLAGCEEGPVEEAGEEIDDAIDDTGDALD